MINKLKVLIFIFISVFIFNIDVKAGVCNGSTADCDNIAGVIIKDSYNNQTYGSDYLRPGHVAVTNKGDSAAFCLDPGHSVPSEVLTKVRELQLEDDYDKKIYRMYQELYNNLLYQSNQPGGLTNNYVNTHRSYFEFALRTFTYSKNYGMVGGDNYTEKFKTCAHYLDSNVSAGTINVSEESCFNGHKGDIDSGGIASYYDNKSSNLYWINPLKITSSAKKITGGDGKTYYRYEFDVDFTDGSSHFFGQYSKAIYFNELKLDSAQFNLDSFSVNNEYCTASNCYNYNGAGVVDSGDSKKLMVELTEEQYNDFSSKRTDGKVIVTLHYHYNHPLNIENLYISKYKEHNKYQRMLVVENFIHYGDESVSIDAITSEPMNACLHDGTGYYNRMGNKVNTIEEFINDCFCTPVNKELLSSSEELYYTNKCVTGFISDESFSGGILDCVDENYKDYEVSYEKTSIINNYCTETCKETININNLKGKFTTKAGMYFEFNKYPEIIANKSCNVNIKYDKWKLDYKENLSDLVDAYNEWQEALAAEKTYNQSSSCCDGYLVDTDGDGNKDKYICTKDIYTYKGTYSGYKVVDNYKLESTTKHIGNNVNGVTSSCGDDIDWYSTSKGNYFKNKSSVVTSIYNLQQNLRQCNTYIKEDNVSFYPFQEDLKFYYAQTLSSETGMFGSSGRTLLNDQRESSGLGGINDSFFDGSPSVVAEDNNLNDGSAETYDTFNLSDGSVIPNSINIYVGNNIHKEVTYKTNYSPKYEKGSNFYTGFIDDITNLSEEDRKDYIVLGRGYDTLISAVQKNNNEFYYRFDKLGDSNNKIFNHLVDSDLNYIKRSCTYEVTNDIIKGCEEGDCSDSDEVSPKINLVYRMVDPLNIDPNNRLGDKGFKNWNNDKGKSIIASIEKDASTNSVFSPDNLEYSFELDSIKIKDIRDNVNAGEMYSDFKGYSCNSDGNECKGEFVYNYAKKDEYNQLVGNGRMSWKNWMKENSTGKCYVDSVEVPCS